MVRFFKTTVWHLGNHLKTLRAKDGKNGLGRLIELARAARVAVPLVGPLWW